MIFVKNWKKVNVSDRNKMRRIILFIDELYNHRTKLFALSEGPVEELFQTEKGQESEESFMMHRCQSRLNEIMSKHYMSKNHISLTSKERSNINK